MKLRIIQAQKNELDWINRRYDEVQFAHSDMDNEFIAIATLQDEKAGLGRVIKIDDKNAELGGMYVLKEYRGLGIASEIIKFLLQNAKKYRQIFCLPFAHLKGYYRKFGFVPITETEMRNVPEKIRKKHEWYHKTYDTKVLLLVLKQ